MSAENRIGEGKYVISVDSSGAISELTRFEQKATSAARNTSTSFRQALTSTIGLASGIGSLYFQYDNLEKVQLRIRRSALEVSRAQEEVNKLAREGQKGTLDYQQALERLEIAQERNRILTDDLKQSQVALGFSIAQTALTLPSAINGIKGLTAATSVLNLANSKFILIALAVIAAYEGITQAIKHLTGQDYTLSSATGKLMDTMMGANKVTDDGVRSFEAYGESVAGVGVSASLTNNSLTNLNKTIDISSIKVDNLKKKRR